MDLLEGRLHRCELEERAGDVGGRVLRMKGQRYQPLAQVDEVLLVRRSRQVVRGEDLDGVLAGCQAGQGPGGAGWEIEVKAAQRRRHPQRGVLVHARIRDDDVIAEVVDREVPADDIARLRGQCDGQTEGEDKPGGRHGRPYLLQSAEVGTNRSPALPGL